MKYKIKDKVRALKDINTIIKGDTGVIRSIEIDAGYPYAVLWGGDKGEYCVKDEEIELVEDFKIGDRVEVTKDSGVLKRGMKGKIVGFYVDSKEVLSVEFDEKNIHFHDCGGKAKLGHGWNVSRNELRLSKPRKKVSKKVLNSKIKKIIKEIKSIPDYSKCFESVEKEVKSWSEEIILNYRLNKRK